MKTFFTLIAMSFLLTTATLNVDNTKDLEMNKIINGDNILCKHEKMVTEFEHLTDRTKAIVLYTTHFMVYNLNCIPIWTSFYREQKPGKPLSVHNLFRGADMSIRVFDLSGSVQMRKLTNKKIETICRAVNKVFPYGKKNVRSCIYHKVYGSAYHLHLQAKI